MRDAVQLTMKSGALAEQLDIGSVPFDLVEGVRAENRGSVLESLLRRARRTGRRHGRTGLRVWGP